MTEPVVTFEADVQEELLVPRDLTHLFGDDDPETPLWWATVADMCDQLALLLSDAAPLADTDEPPADPDPDEAADEPAGDPEETDEGHHDDDTGDDATREGQ